MFVAEGRERGVVLLGERLFENVCVRTERDETMRHYAP